jgi:single-stranded-DNA-specific exonuclease
VQKRWTIQQVDEQNIQLLQQELKIHVALCKILLHRGIDTFEKAKSFSDLN